jgi:hypothetical protein
LLVKHFKSQEKIKELEKLLSSKNHLESYDPNISVNMSDLSAMSALRNEKLPSGIRIPLALDDLTNI